MPVQQLIGVLERLTEAHESLLGLAEQKKEALIANKVDEVSAIVNKETKLAKAVDELLKEQADATNLFFKSKGLQPTRAINVTELSRLIHDSQLKGALLSERDRLVAVIERLKAVNRLNQELLEQSIAFVNFSVDLVMGPPVDEPVYQRPAHQQGNIKPRPGLFDRKA
ncbi:flagellar protein FlgN [Paenibacillus thermotolerans]|uniref:flagellar protein FlgN n=1 Tax=Paenibacillus thermotolerans TaxID=3027807 RepID=UPI0023682A2F|nr:MULTISPECIES: flagellar protein FlgN [unclassified Paenibacillus]